MEILSIVGLVFGAIAIFGGTVAKGSGLAALWNIAAFIIVIIGTLGAGFLQARTAAFKRAMSMLSWLINPPGSDMEAAVEKIVNWSQIARKEGLLGLESVAEQEPDPFAKKGLQLLVDGTEAETIRRILEVDIGTKEHFDTQGAKVYEAFGIYSPTLGIIGAVMGLMAVMQNLAEPEKLGPGIAAAFVATIYGIGLANLFFLPAASKLKSIVQEQTAFREMMVDGITSIAEGENPRNIEVKLRGYMH